jgi:hypothetical protein
MFNKTCNRIGNNSALFCTLRTLYPTLKAITIKRCIINLYQPNQPHAKKMSRSGLLTDLAAADIIMYRHLDECGVVNQN